MKTYTAIIITKENGIMTAEMEAESINYATSVFMDSLNLNYIKDFKIKDKKQDDLIIKLNNFLSKHQENEEKYLIYKGRRFDLAIERINEIICLKRELNNCL